MKKIKRMEINIGNDGVKARDPCFINYKGVSFFLIFGLRYRYSMSMTLSEYRTCS